MCEWLSGSTTKHHLAPCAASHSVLYNHVDPIHGICLIPQARGYTQISGQPGREAAWWGPKDDKALLQGYHKHGGITWVSKTISAAVETILSDTSLEFSVKVNAHLTAATMATAVS